MSVKLRIQLKHSYTVIPVTATKVGVAPGCTRGLESRELIIFRIVGAAGLCLIAQLATSTHTLAALLLTAAVVCGLFAVSAAGGVATVAGLLSAVILTRYLLVAIVVKTLTWKPTDDTLQAPLHTPAVMALGFFGLLLGVLVQRSLPKPSPSPIPDPSGTRMYLAVTLVLFVLGYGGYFLIGESGDYQGTGGIFGIAHAVAQLKSFAIVPAMFYVWAKGSRRFLTHPLVLSVLSAGVIIGALTTSKQNAMEPLVFLLVVYAMRYGIRDKRLIAMSLAALLYYAAIIYPYAQYSRGNGGREGDFLTRLAAAKNIFWLMLTDPNYRSEAEASDEDPLRSSYFDSERLEPFNRLAMIGEADRLIYATDAQQAFTGWETIGWGFERMLPRFINPNKPVFGAANFLAQITGDTGLGDLTTQVSFGVMANFYNAYGLTGVFVGSFGFFAAFFYCIRFWFGDTRVGGLTQGGSLWALLVVANLHHSLVEESFAGLLPSMELPIVVLAIYLLAKVTAGILPASSDKQVFASAR